MPIEMERHLRQEAASKFPGDEARQDRYVYGTLRKQGWRPGKHHSPVTEWYHWYFGKLKLSQGVDGGQQGDVVDGR